jgi:predicted ABC-type exoprotein transport system permease subunit
MKRVLAVVGQFCLFFVVFLAGTLWDPFHLRWFVTQPSPTSTRYFVPDGLILCVLLYLVILAIEAVVWEQRWRLCWRWSWDFYQSSEWRRMTCFDRRRELRGWHGGV